MGLIEREVAHGVLILTLADEERRNALSSELTAELVSACEEADADPEVRVVVLTNRGSTFCAGANLAERGEGSSTPATPIDPMRLFGRFADSPKPYVGRIAGHCVAGGMGLAAGLDITVAQSSAKFGFTEVRIGVAPAMISVVCLPKLRTVDAQAAFLRGRRFDAVEAARMGLVTYVVEDDRLDATVGEIVDDLLLAGPQALAAAKQLISRVPSMDRESAFAWTRQLSGELFASDEAREGMSAYLEKRPARWVPRDSGDSKSS
jgi:methylglutaconyl-CoA hydratase